MKKEKSPIKKRGPSPFCPPKFILRILRRFALYEEMFGISQEFESEYEDRLSRRGRFLALLWLSGNTFFAAIHYFRLVLQWRIGMLRSYLKIAFRNLKRHKTFSFINTLGLAVGMAACLLMLMYVVSEISFDNFHENVDRIYRVTAEWGEEGSKRNWAGTMPGISPTMKSELPEIAAAARVRNVLNAEVSNSAELSFRETAAFYADPDVFHIMTWPLLQGDPQKALAEPFSLVLSEKTARKYFGNEDPLRNILSFNDRPFQITGIMKDLPDNTHLKAEILVSYATAESLGDYPEKPWDVWGDDYNYFLLKENAEAHGVEEKLTVLLKKYASPWIAKKMGLKIQPLSDIHWDNRSRADIGPKGNLLYVYLFLSLSILVLIIACFNFMNLSTARYLDRMREVGVRKVVGAKRSQLIHQFLTESLLVSVISACLGVYLFTLLKKSLYTLLNIEVIFSTYQFIFLCGIIVTLVASVGLVAGVYPALFLSRFRPVDIMKRRFIAGQARPAFRQISVVIQYAISIILILGTVIIYQQIDFMKNSDLGFDKENVILLTLPFNNPEVIKKYVTLVEQLRAQADVTSVTGAYTVPGIDSNFQMSVRKAGAAEDSSYSLQILPGDIGYIRSMGLKLVKGCDVSDISLLDARESAILNETAVKTLGLEHPIGEKLLISDNREKTIVGVVKDFHVKSLHNEIRPMMIYHEPKMYGTLAVRIRPEDPEAALLALQKAWESVLPFADFNYRYMEDAYHRFYRTEEKTGTLTVIFTGLALLVSCLGLFGLAAFSASKRVKETGIRKILGATPAGIVILLTKQFTQWVIIANVIAWPVAYYLLHKWLDNFAYRINISPLPFVLSGAAALAIAVLTVCLITIKTAAADPVQSLRYE
jgi:putative ABC transport system permease protein